MYAWQLHPYISHQLTHPSPQHSQSQRIIWLLEELGIEYKLVLYARVQGRAPPEMKSVHQLGKSPTLVTADGKAIIESSAIVAYLLKTYDTDGKFASEDWLRDEVLTSFAGASLGPVNAIELLFDIASRRTPWPLVYIARKVRGGIQRAFTSAEFEKDLQYLEGELGDREWFNGKQLGRSDVMLSFPVDTIAQRGWVDLAKDYPKIDAWRKRIWSRQAWKRGLEKGNGYDLNLW